MKVPGNSSYPQQDGGGKWSTIRYAIDRWGTTLRLTLILLAAPASIGIVAWLVVHR
jgi:hypothetical protein